MLKGFPFKSLELILKPVIVRELILKALELLLKHSNLIGLTLKSLELLINTRQAEWINF